MRVETHNSLKEIRSITATRCVIYDDLDNVVGVAIQRGSFIYLINPTMPEFDIVMEELGLRKSEITYFPAHGKGPSR